MDQYNSKQEKCSKQLNTCMSNLLIFAVSGCAYKHTLVYYQRLSYNKLVNRTEEKNNESKAACVHVREKKNEKKQS